jgi:hypothetical protein
MVKSVVRVRDYSALHRMDATVVFRACFGDARLFLFLSISYIKLLGKQIKTKPCMGGFFGCFFPKKENF